MPGKTVDQNAETRAPRYILITQCLQNDFFLNRESHLRLPDEQVLKMLVGNRTREMDVHPLASRMRLDTAQGPLGMFLQNMIGTGFRHEDCARTLHVINIRDWHKPGASYDKERALYGSHCEAGTWGACYLDGLTEYLDPARAGDGDNISAEGKFYSKGSVRVYHVLSDYLFDFKPHSGCLVNPRHTGKFLPSRLENLLDVIMLGSTDQVDELALVLADQRKCDACESDPRLQALAATARESGTSPRELYLAVIGVYTDIKVKILLASLRARYEIPNLAVSDTLTASPTLERHLEALDFSQKVLGVQVIHGLNDLIRFLGGAQMVENEKEVITADPFADYASFFQDKQNVLAYEREKLQESLLLTQHRSEMVYRSIELGNNFLVWSGALLLLLAIIATVLNLFYPARYNLKLPLATGGLGLLQIVSSLFARPMDHMQKNLTNMATFRMVLESHSMKTALARFHLTTPQVLREKVDPNEAAQQVAALKAQFEVLESLEKDYQILKELGFGPTRRNGKSAQKGADG